LTSPALAARGVSRRFGQEPALVEVDLRVDPGEVVALVGLNGAGKSTLMRLLLGMLRPDAGQVEVLGQPVRAAGAAVWSRVGHLIETPPRYRELTVRESIYSAARLQGRDRATAERLTAGTISLLELEHWRDRRTGTLSLGNRQRLGIAAAVVHRPDVLVLDEPSNSLDPLGVVRVRELLRTCANEQRSAVLVSSHHLDEVARMADRIVVLHRGRTLGELDPAGRDVERAFFTRVLNADQNRAAVR
jgi:ABC-2 type transport system ATP-binding protein